MAKLNDIEVEEAKVNLRKDALDLYYKSCFSIAKAINSISHGLHSWSVVQLYYSVFYAMRAELAINDIGFAKNNGIYIWRLSENEGPEKVDGKRVRGDHASTIKAYKKIVGESDVLQTNTIDEVCVYSWLMERRNDVNYRDRSFS
ncbi:MAG: hypothetical protein ACPG51_20735, partial [Thiolinea sp.]